MFSQLTINVYKICVDYLFNNNIFYRNIKVVILIFLVDEVLAIYQINGAFNLSTPNPQLIVSHRNTTKLLII